MNKELSVLNNWTAEELDVIKTTMAKGATDAELKVFLMTCTKHNLDPIRRQIFLVKRWNAKNQREEATIQIGIDGFRAIAERTGVYAGNDEPAYEENDGKPVKASVTVYKLVKGQRMPFTATARWTEYYPGDKQGFMWKSKPYLMLGKCAEALALRKAFPEDIGDLYIEEELQRADIVFDDTDVETIVKQINDCQTLDDLKLIKTSLLMLLNKLPAEKKKQVMEATAAKHKLLSETPALPSSHSSDVPTGETANAGE